MKNMLATFHALLPNFKSSFLNLLWDKNFHNPLVSPKLEKIIKATGLEKKFKISGMKKEDIPSFQLCPSQACCKKSVKCFT